MEKELERKLWIFNILFALAIIIYVMYNLTIPRINAQFPDSQIKESDAQIRYLALGDSYTIGTGVPESKNWPNLLTNKLKKDGIDIELISNPARNGYTTFELINFELPILEESNANFVTILIGVNDWRKGISKEEFRTNFKYILNEVDEKVGNENILIVTIPDFSTATNANRYANGRDISVGIFEFNSIIIEEANKKDIKYADIYPLTRDLDDEKFFAEDRLHPSEIAYELWVNNIIYKKVEFK